MISKSLSDEWWEQRGERRLQFYFNCWINFLRGLLWVLKFSVFLFLCKRTKMKNSRNSRRCETTSAAASSRPRASRASFSAVSLHLPSDFSRRDAEASPAAGSEETQTHGHVRKGSTHSACESTTFPPSRFPCGRIILLRLRLWFWMKSASLWAAAQRLQLLWV